MLKIKFYNFFFISKLGNILFKMNKIEKAMEDFDYAIELDIS